MDVFSQERFKILFRKKWTTTGLAAETAGIDRELLQNEFEELKKLAPRRAATGKCYFSDQRNGSISTKQRIDNSSKADRKRFEEHLAMALWGLKASWPGSDGKTFELLDYQFPLKSAQSDRGIGEVDLLGLTEAGKLVVVELKVPSRSAGARKDAPVAALVQGLRYAAIVQANMEAIASEIQNCFKMQVTEAPPAVQIIAPKSWWTSWTDLPESTRRKAGEWERELTRLMRDVEKNLWVRVECLALDIQEEDLEFEMDGRRPHLNKIPPLYPVWLDQSCLFGPALALNLRE